MRPKALLIVVALVCPMAYGQAVKGTLLGTVTDPSGAVVPGAGITITEVNTGISRSTETNASGYYVFANLEIGTYRVAVELPGFRKAVRDGVEVQVNSTVPGGRRARARCRERDHRGDGGAADTPD